MALFVGTSGYSYKEWLGSFYPEKHPAREMLRFYAGQLSAVEINNTFYRFPKPSVLESWAEQVPASFRFSLKASRRITHIKRLKEVEDETRYLLTTAAILGERLGVILFQLPPFLKKDASRLQRFLDLLPAGTRAAFEFRHVSWSDEETCEQLRQRGCALCVAETDEEESTRLISTRDWGYLRLRRKHYSDADLQNWIRQVNAWGWGDTFVFFKHEDEGTGPRLARRFTELARQAKASKK